MTSLTDPLISLIVAVGAQNVYVLRELVRVLGRQPAEGGAVGLGTLEQSAVDVEYEVAEAGPPGQTVAALPCQ